jgi:lipid-binding SYLF domain-containing protein
MKILCLTLSSLAACAAFAHAEVSSDETNRLNAAATAVRELRAAPDKGVPEDLFKRAECVAVIPGLKKAAFLIGGEYGKGVVSCRTGQMWSPPAFLVIEKGSAGLQIGGEQTDLVLLIMNRSGVEKLLGDKVTLGADLSVAAGPVGRNAAAGTDGRLTAQILAYSRSKGAFAGIDISGGSLRPDKRANTDAYGPEVTAQEIVNAQKATAPGAATLFLQALTAPNQAADGR